MDSATAQRLLALNRGFYDRFGADFSATRRRLQTGVIHFLETLTGDETILDLGCGNGELARTLARRNHFGSYLGLDFSLPLLSDARSLPDSFSALFLMADLTSLNWEEVRRKRKEGDAALPSHFSRITCFATLHHIPSRDLRLQLLQTVHKLLAPNGQFLPSNWQFLNSAKLRARVQPWERIGLTAGDVDEGDYLLDWKRGGEGLRYVHQFSEQELAELADTAGFRVFESFYSDGEGGRLGLYQVWNKK